MAKFPWLAAFVASASLASCADLEVRGDRHGTTVNVAPPAPASAGAGAVSGEDRHWIGGDEVFMAQYEGQSGQPCFEVSIARLLEAPSGATKGEGKLFSVREGKEVWSSHYWRTRPAERSDLRQGVTVIFFKGPLTAHGAHGGPASKADARPGGDCWFRATISDASDAFKGVVKVAGYDYPVQEAALRVDLP